MSAVSAAAAGSPAQGIGQRIVGHSPVQATVRWVFILAMTTVAFWSTLSSLVTELRAGTLITYVPAALVLTAMAGYGTSLRFHTELPIYDRQTDVIVGVVLMILSISIDGLMTQRFFNNYLITHVDLLAMWQFVLASAVMLFGLRPVARYRWSWILGLIAMYPIPYRSVVLALGGDRIIAGAVMVIFAAAAAAVACARTRHHAVIAALVASAVGAVVLLGIAVFAVDAPLIVYQSVPALVGGLSAGAIMYVDHRRGLDSWAPYNREFHSLRVTSPRRSAVFIAVCAAAMFFLQPPPISFQPNVYVPGINTQPPLIVPPTWVQTASANYTWTSRLYGRRSHLMRQELRQVQGNPEWDKFSRPRKVMADSIYTRYPLSLDVYRIIFVYDLVGDRFSEWVPVELPHGITGLMQTVVDDTNFLTYNTLVWRWNDGTSTQQVTLMSVDDHEPDAVFPTPQMTTARNLTSMLTVVFRGTSVVEDLQPNFKDQDLLVSCANDLINAQIAAIGTGSAR